MDDTDRLIMKFLQQDSSLSMRALSEKTGIALTTVHSRLKNLKSTGVIRGYTLDVDHDKLGYHVLAIVSVMVDNEYMRKKGITQNDLTQQLMDEDEVEEAYSVTGENDIILKVRSRGIEDMNDFLIHHARKIPGVVKTNTQVVLFEGKNVKDDRADRSGQKREG